MSHEIVDATITQIAFIGHPNVGKTSVLSTLAELDNRKIKNIPGTTVENDPVRLFDNEEPILQLIDTPGFENDQELIDWLDCKGIKGLDAAKLMVNEFVGSQGFEGDVEILKLLSEDVIVVYVVDDSHPIRRVDRNELAILESIASKCIAVINTHCENMVHKFAWKILLEEREINSFEFHAFKATLTDRMNLLRKINEGCSTNKKIESWIIRYEAEWNNRISLSAKEITKALTNITFIQFEPELDIESGISKHSYVEVNSLYKHIEQTVEQYQEAISDLYRHKVRNVRLPFELKLEKSDVKISKKGPWLMAKLVKRSLTKWWYPNILKPKCFVNVSLKLNSSIHKNVLEYLVDYFYMAMTQTHAFQTGDIKPPHVMISPFDMEDIEQLNKLIFSKNKAQEIRMLIEEKLNIIKP